MTGSKRFCSEDNCTGYYTEVIDNEKVLDLALPNPQKNLTIEELIRLLNGLYDENEELKSDNKCYVKRYSELFDDYIACKKENEQLKSENNMLKVTIGRNEAYIKRLTETSEWRC